MILSRELGKRIWGGSTSIDNGGGGVSSDYIAGLLAGYATESWVDEHYISIDFFSRLFQAHGTENGSEIDVMPNDMETTITSVESMFGFWTNLYISALGSNGAAPAGISLGMLTDVTISGTPSAGQVLTYDAVSGKWVNGNATGASSLATLTDVTLTSLDTNQILVYNATTQKWVNSSLKTIDGYSIFGTGDIPASGGGGGNYLPLAGGTMTGVITFDYTRTGYDLTFKYNGAMKGGLGYWPADDIIFISDEVSGRQLRFFNNKDIAIVDIFRSGVPEVITFTSGGNIRFRESLPRNSAPTYVCTFHNNTAPDGLAYTLLSDIDYFLPKGGLYNSNAGSINWGALSTANGYTTVFQWLTPPYSGNAGGYGFAYLNGEAYMQVDGFFYQNEGQYRVYDVSGGTIYGSVYATGAVTALSDIRRKDVQDFDIGLTVEKVAEAPTIRFLWKDKKDDGMQVGSIAQFWQSALPEVVRTEDDDNLSLQYGVAALLSAIVTARKVVDHERRITELEKENERLKEEISQLRLN